MTDNSRYAIKPNQTKLPYHRPARLPLRRRDLARQLFVFVPN